MNFNVHGLRPWTFQEVPRGRKKFQRPAQARSQMRLTDIKASRRIHA